MPPPARVRWFFSLAIRSSCSWDFYRATTWPDSKGCGHSPVRPGRRSALSLRGDWPPREVTDMSRLFGPLRQMGYVVPDVEAAMRHWIEVCGVGPWFYAE